MDMDWDALSLEAADAKLRSMKSTGQTGRSRRMGSERNFNSAMHKYDTAISVMTSHPSKAQIRIYNFAFGASNVGRRRSLISPAASFK